MLRTSECNQMNTVGRTAAPNRPLNYLSNKTRALKRLLFCAFCLLLAIQSSSRTSLANNWTRQATPTMAFLHAVYFVDEYHGWVAGSRGTLLATSDGGKTWKRALTLTADSLEDVYFADQRSGWLLAERDELTLKSNDEVRSYLLKTDDGGLSWTRVIPNASGENSRLARLLFVSAQRGWVFGETGIIMATIDGGAHWTRQSAPTKHLLLAGAALDEAHAWLSGAGSIVVQTVDGGGNWQRGIVRDDNATRFHALTFVDNRLGWAVGAGGRIFATRDGGGTWLAQVSPVSLDLFDIKFVDTWNGWAAGEQGVLLHTIDGGRHWVVESTSTTHLLQRLFFTDRNHGWAVGFGGMILALESARAPQLSN